MSAPALEATLCGRMTIFGLNILAEHLGPHIAEFEESFEPVELFEPAARGDLEAQRTLAMYCAFIVWREIMAESGGDLTASLAEAISLGRLAAAQGDTTDKLGVIIYLAMGAIYSSGFASSREWAAECVARLELLADEGHERAAEVLASMAGSEPPEVLELAQIYRDRFKAVQESK